MTFARLRRVLFLVVLLALVFAVAIRWPRERLLFDRAVNVAAMDDWDEYRPLKKAAFGHNWLSDQEVLFARESANEQGKANRYFILNTRSGITAPAVKYEKALQMAEASYGVKFSPDRQWFYAEQWRGNGLEVVKSDGSRKYSFKEKGYPLLWLSDSLYINSISAEDYSDEWKTEKNCLRLRSIVDRRILKDFPDIEDGIYEPGHIYCNDHFVMLSNKLDDTTHQFSVEVTKTGLGLDGYPARKQVFVLSLPNQQNIKDVEAKLSPDGTRIVYRCVQRGVPSWLVWLQRLYPRFDLKPQQNVALWVSDVDGKHVHEVGHINLGEEKNTEDYEDTYIDFEWLPSSKRLAFRYKERLYTVVAD